MATDDRRTLLCNQSPILLNGIDFVQVVEPFVQTVLRVYFIIDPVDMDPPWTDADFDPGMVQINATYPGEPIEEVPVTATSLVETPGERPYVEVTVASPGGFSKYTLSLRDQADPTLTNPRVDFAFNDVEFSFKQGCPTRVDCCDEVDRCQPSEVEDFPVDYLARDFVSLRNALIDFAAQRYPQWTLPIVADAGTMMAEIMAALGDEFAYIQDRYSREAYIGTATQRRSLRHHAHLVDYEIQEPINASTLLELTVEDGAGAVLLASGVPFWAVPEGAPPIPFSSGNGLADQLADPAVTFRLDEDWQDRDAYISDPSKTELPCGATSILIQGTITADPELWVGRDVLLAEISEEAGQSSARLLVQPTSIETGLFDSLCGEFYTRITWDSSQAIPCAIDLTRTKITANLVPATAGVTRTEYFVVGEDSFVHNDETYLRAVERQGPLNELTCERTPIVMYSLRASESENVGWLGAVDNADPEISVQQLDDSPTPVVIDQWEFRKSLLSSGALSEHYTLDDGMWRPIIRFRNLGDVIVHEDYANQSGMTVRFGDGEFGLIPAAGDRFRAIYRTGPGTGANLPAGTVTALKLQEGDLTPPGIAAVNNPFVIQSGIDEEPAGVIKQLAPEAFRAVTYRAVRPDDYDEIAERLDWVQRAGTAFRWTGSYLTAFVTPDPLDAYTLSAPRRTELENLIDCVRQVGRCAFVSDPVFVDIDLIIEICIDAGAFGGQVRTRIIEVLTGRGGSQPIEGFFDPNNFTFGTPLRRSKLEAAIQGVQGVKAVEKIYIRARGKTEFVEWKSLTYEVADDEIIRMQNDPRFPGRGSVAIEVMEVVS